MAFGPCLRDRFHEIVVVVVLKVEALALRIPERHPYKEQDVSGRHGCGNSHRLHRKVALRLKNRLPDEMKEQIGKPPKENSQIRSVIDA